MEENVGGSERQRAEFPEVAVEPGVLRRWREKKAGGEGETRQHAVAQQPSTFQHTFFCERHWVCIKFLHQAQR